MEKKPAIRRSPQLPKPGQVFRRGDEPLFDQILDATAPLRANPELRLKMIDSLLERYLR